MTPEAYLARVRALLPALRERAAQVEELRRLPDETFADFQREGLFRALQPKRYGGYELDPDVFYQAVAEVSAVCGSTGWILGVLGVHNWHVAILPPQAQEDVWGEDDSIQLSTSLAPTGSVERAPGGYRLKGRWSFSSGCDHCQWAVLGGVAPPATASRPICACSCCRAAIIGSTTTGTSWGCAAPAVRISSSMAPLSPNTAPTPIARPSPSTIRVRRSTPRRFTGCPGG